MLAALPEDVLAAVPAGFSDVDGEWVGVTVRLDADAHAADLHRANSADSAIWDYLPYGPFSSAAAYHRWIRQITAAHMAYSKNTSAHELMKAAVATGFKTLADDACRRVIEGVTSLEEITRVVDLTGRAGQ